MNITTKPIIRPFRLVTTAIAAVTLAACGSTSTSSGADADSSKRWHESEAAAEAGVSPTLFLGDSVAAGEAAPLTQALAASGTKFVNGTSIGGGNVTGPNAQAQWKKLSKTLAKAQDGIAIYQITSYDWGTPEQQKTAYERLGQEAAEVGADLAIVSMPPIKPDSFYKPHMGELANATEAAQDVARSADNVEFLDASGVWGTEYRRERDGKVDRSSDGIHTCPQGAARFTDWLLDELAGLYPGFEPADADEWANTGWSSDKSFRGC